jgi:DNA-binding GntR family transcriptional regulator
MTELSFNLSVPAAPLREQIVDRLRTAITECRFEPGGRLVERELCALMGVSRGSLREAMRQLEAEGLVTPIPNKGVVVATLSLEEARETYQTRAVLEGFVGRLFAERAGEAEIAALARTVRNIETALRRGNQTGLSRAKTAFYEIMVQGCRNAVAAGLLKQLRARVALLRSVYLTSEARAWESLEENKRILAAIERRDPDATWAACMAHIDRTADAALAMLAAEQDEEHTESARTSGRRARLAGGSGA